MKTIREAVAEALDEWAASDIGDAEPADLAEEYALAAVERWKDEIEAGGRKLLGRDDQTICGAVLAAMDDWASSGHSLADMEALVSEHVERAVGEWIESGRAPAIRAPVI